jgi:signal transduction histidine kinase
METTLERLSRLVRNLIDSARVDFSQAGDLKQSIDLNELIASAANDCGILAEHRNIQLKAKSDAIAISGNKDRIREVLLNLISNALTHTPSGGSVNLIGKKKNDVAEIFVQDTGLGIAPENLPNIFDRFYKIDRKGISEGVGLGLHICRKIIEAHGGTITAQSERGKGTTFIIHLPLASP